VVPGRNLEPLEPREGRGPPESRILRLSRLPAFTVVALTVPALGIGAGTAVPVKIPISSRVGTASCCGCDNSRPSVRVRSRFRAGEPVQWAAFGVGDGQHQQVSLVALRTRSRREPLDGCLADQRAFCPRARPCRVGFWGVADSIEGSRNLRDELVAQSWTSLVVPECGAAKLGLRLRM
jgi:hypothetical protein